MSRVMDLDGYRPCAVFDLGKQVHVVPIDTIKKWAGTEDFACDEDALLVVRKIISEWIRFKGV